MLRNGRPQCRRDASLLVRLALIPIIIVGLQSWGDLLVTVVNGLISDMGANGNGANIFQAYQAAIARKLGVSDRRNEYFPD